MTSRAARNSIITFEDNNMYEVWAIASVGALLAIPNIWLYFVARPDETPVGEYSRKKSALNLFVWAVILTIQAVWMYIEFA